MRIPFFWDMKPHYWVIVTSVSKDLEPRDMHGLEYEGTMTE
jgi:hypothetical protein